MQIKTISVGSLETNCYIIKDNGFCCVIDPGEDVEKILNELGEDKLDYIFLTHLHFDHIIAAKETKRKTGAKIVANKKDLEILDENILKENEINDLNNELRIMNYGINIMETPGHTPGSVCYYFPDEKILFSGDTIFKGSIGATHFKGGNFEALKKSIEEKIFTLPNETKVYPGHGKEFILEKEKENIKNVLR